MSFLNVNQFHSCGKYIRNWQKLRLRMDAPPMNGFNTAFDCLISYLNNSRKFVAMRGDWKRVDYHCFLSLEGSYPPSFGGRSFALFSWTECHRWALPLVRCAAQNSARANHKYFLQRKGSNTLRMISVLLPPTSTLRFLWPLTWFRVTWHRTPSIMQAIAYRLSVAIFRSFIFWFVFRGRQFWDLELLDYNSVWFSFIQIWPTFWFIYQYLD